MAKLANSVWFTPATGGTADFTVSAAVQGFMTPAQAGAVGGVYRYRAESPDLTQFEMGEGTYNSSTGVLTRTTVFYNSSGTGTLPGQSGAGTKINFSTAPNVGIVQLADDATPILFSDTAPSTTSAVFWFNTTNGQLYVNYNDGTSQQWVAASMLATLPGTVQYDVAQSLSTAQQNQAKTNIGVNTALTPYIFRGQIFAGFTLSTAGSSTSFGVSAGSGADPTGTDFISLTSAFTKTTAAWAAGSGNGSLDTGTIAASTWYHAYAIKNVTTGAVDILISLSATAPTLPSGYTLALRLGPMKTNASSQWVKFIQKGDEFLWDTWVNNLLQSATVTTASLLALEVPPGVQVVAYIYARMDYNGGATAVLITSPDESDQAPTTQVASLVAISANAVTSGNFSIRTNLTQQVRHRSTATVAQLTVSTIGWIDPRGKVF